MDTATLTKLKKKTLISWNVLMLFLGSIYLLLIAYYPLEIVLAGVGLFVFLTGVYDILTYKKTTHLFPWSRQLAEYTKDKLGPEWNKQRIGSGVISICLGIILVWTNVPFITEQETNESLQTGPLVGFSLIILLIFIILMNVSQLYSFKKTEEKSTEELQGSFVRNSILGLLIGLGLTWVLFFSTIMFIVFFI
ncbi:hypothetical protein [Alkalicoccobacillus murimartini]|uniref:DUF456 domain-containing protein n=1 Tax=Alkalicoccobacillus murimartini TaxID=171685 RepID=A0ABT9YBS0_9BACI|nr:hypothetical protein [Alkalicoccobacillus murimartini]MDQ0205262.1 hypothetical protein [Alkalicoccobacillus murimartini]